MTKKEEELLMMKEWSLTIINYLLNVETRTTTLPQFIQIINETAENGNIRGMRMIYRDVNEMAASLRSSDLIELNNLLKKKFGEDLNSKEDLSKIQKILKKNVISNETEFRLVLGYVDANFQNDDQKAFIDSLNKLLADFETKK